MKIIYRVLDIYRRKFWDGVRYARHKGVMVGDGCRILSSKYSEPFLIEIGNNVTISTDVTLLTHDGSTWLFRDESGRRYDYRKIKISDNCFIGANSTLLPGVEIGCNVIIGAGSVVTKSIPSGWVVAGNPAQFICYFESLRLKALAEYPSDRDIDSANLDLSILKHQNQLSRPMMRRTSV